MKRFDSFLGLAQELALRPAEIAVQLHRGLEAAAQRIENTAKGEFGTYQEAAGPFPGWPELADATKDDRVRKGYSENEPLLRSGELRDSIERQVEGLEAVIGSKDDRMAFHEFGTSRMPARPVLGPAAFHNKDVLQKLVGAAVVSGLVGQDKIHEALGYDMETKD